MTLRFPLLVQWTNDPDEYTSVKEMTLLSAERITFLLMPPWHAVATTTDCIKESRLREILCWTMKVPYMHVQLVHSTHGTVQVVLGIDPLLFSWINPDMPWPDSVDICQLCFAPGPPDFVHHELMEGDPGTCEWALKEPIEYDGAWTPGCKFCSLCFHMKAYVHWGQPETVLDEAEKDIPGLKKYTGFILSMCDELDTQECRRAVRLEGTRQQDLVDARCSGTASEALES